MLRLATAKAFPQEVKDTWVGASRNAARSLSSSSREREKPDMSREVIKGPTYTRPTSNCAHTRVTLEESDLAFREANEQRHDARGL